jgi:hypothetical protein
MIGQFPEQRTCRLDQGRGARDRVISIRKGPVLFSGHSELSPTGLDGGDDGLREFPEAVDLVRISEWWRGTESNCRHYDFQAMLNPAYTRMRPQSPNTF